MMTEDCFAYGIPDDEVMRLNAKIRRLEGIIEGLRSSLSDEAGRSFELHQKLLAAQLPDGWVAVRLYLSEEQHLAYWNADNIHGTPVTSKDITDGDRLILQRTWTDMIAAAPKLAGEEP